MKVSIKSVLLTYWVDARKYKAMIVGMVFFAILSSTAEVIVPLYYKRFFDVIGGKGILASSVALLLSTIGIIALFKIGGQLCWRVSIFIMSRFEARMMKDLSERAFVYLMGHSYQFFTDHFSGTLVRRATLD
jgi:ABC-type multidrug transport system fused ATPase/permease subunit